MLEPLKRGSSAIKGEHVLVVDDILISGLTLNLLLDAELTCRNPASLKTTVFVKRETTNCFVKPDYIGILAPDYVIVGYGTGKTEVDRNYPHLIVMDKKGY